MKTVLKVGQVYSKEQIAEGLWGHFGKGSHQFKANSDWLRSFDFMLRDGGYMVIPFSGFIAMKVGNGKFQVVSK